MAPARNIATRSGIARSVSAGCEGTDRSLTTDDADRLDRQSEDGSIMESKARRQTYPDWRDPSSYADTRNRARVGWIGEFLRRNGAVVWAASELPIRGSLSRQRADWIDAIGGGRGRWWGHGSLRSGRSPHRRCLTAAFLLHGSTLGEMWSASPGGSITDFGAKRLQESVGDRLPTLGRGCPWA
jgi:hypothetical protein